MGQQGNAKLDSKTKRLHGLHFSVLNPIGGGGIDVDATELGVTEIMVTDAEYLTVPFEVIISLDSAEDLTVPPTVSVGTGGGYEQILPAADGVLTELVNEGDIAIRRLNKTAGIAPGTPISLKINSAATATTCSISCTLRGPLVDGGP